MKFTSTDVLKLALCLFVCFLPGIIGGLFTAKSVGTWYPTLVKPSFTPPGWVFGPVWTLLYTLMGISLFLIWRAAAGGADARLAVGVFLAQLVLNGLWSVVFFGSHSLVGGLYIIVPLWLLVLASIFLFWRLSPWAGGLLIPYLVWGSLATALNYSIWRLNPLN